MRRALLAAAAVVAAFAPAASAGCQTGWEQRPLGVYNPLTGSPMYGPCLPYPPTP